tara:strand:+ start:1922 stop:2119 length:198 start_codon:yes stop_codon:yes gene_type:complete
MKNNTYLCHSWQELILKKIDTNPYVKRYTKYLWKKNAAEEEARATNIPQIMSTMVTANGQSLIVA